MTPSVRSLCCALALTSVLAGTAVAASRGISVELKTSEATGAAVSVSLVKALLMGLR